MKSNSSALTCLIGLALVLSVQAPACIGSNSVGAERDVRSVSIALPTGDDALRLLRLRDQNPEIDCELTNVDVMGVVVPVRLGVTSRGNGTMSFGAVTIRFLDVHDDGVVLADQTLSIHAYATAPGVANLGIRGQLVLSDNALDQPVACDFEAEVTASVSEYCIVRIDGTCRPDVTKRQLISFPVDCHRI